jgi:phosphodiesterase/alkaline phosphatase D-like protein
MTLWTRLAPRPLVDGGMPPSPVEVAWEVAVDERFNTISARGKALAEPQWAHTVHVDVDGLQPARPYWYRFIVGNAISPAGRTRTAPGKSEANSRLRFAFAACQQYEQGYFVAYKHLVREEKWLRLFEQLSPIYKWSPGGSWKVQGGAPGTSSYAAIFIGGSAARYFSSGVRRSRLL